MATLNTLRTKGGVFLIVVIAVALVAFLLGDLSSLGGGMNSKKMRIGTINGTHVNYIEFLTEAENTTNVLQTLYGQAALQADQIDQVRQSVWESMVIKNAYMPGFEKLGIGVGDAEMLDMSNGEYISPIVQNVFSNPQTGAFDPAILQNFVASLEYNAAYQPVWNYLTDQMSSERAMSKYVNLVRAGVYVNSLELASAMKLGDANYNAAYATKSFSTVADSLVNVSKSEIKKYYDEHKDNYKQTAARDIEYVVFNLLPSEEDYTEAAERAEEIAAEFAAAEDAMQYASLNSQSKTDTRYYSEENVPANFAALAFGKDAQPMYGPVLNGDVYTMARVAEYKMLPDTVGAKHILMTPGQTATVDSIVKALKGGASFETLASKYSVDPTVDLGRFAPEQMVEEFADACVAAKVGDIFTVDSQYGTHIVNLTYKTKPVRKAQIATVVYNVEPSATTQQTVYGEARAFLEKAGKNYDSFNAAVAETGAARRVATINSTDRGINGLDEASAVTRWAFNGKKGEVSAILDVDGGDYLIGVIKEVREQGTTPLETVSERIASILRNQKKGEMIAAEMEGKTLAEVAQLEGATEGVAEDVNFNSFYIPGLGMEPKFVGAVCVSETGKLSKPVVGGTGVYVFDVNAKNGKNLSEADEKVRLESIATSYISERLSQALDDNTEIVDNRVKFF